MFSPFFYVFFLMNLDVWSLCCCHHHHLNSCYAVGWQTHEKKPRESILRAEFASAIRHINKGLSAENRLRFLHWDLHRQSRKYITSFGPINVVPISFIILLIWFVFCFLNRASNVLFLLGKVAEYALNLTGIFYHQVTPGSRSIGFCNSFHSE